MSKHQRRYPTLKETYLLSEISKEESEAYYKEIQQTNEELYKQLQKMAAFAIRSIRAENTPEDVQQHLKVLTRINQELNPIKSGDTLGVNMFIDQLAKDTEEAGKAKRFYNNAFNALLRNRYKGIQKPTK